MSTSQQIAISFAFFSKQVRRLENVTWRFVVSTIFFILIVLPILKFLQGSLLSLEKQQLRVLCEVYDSYNDGKRRLQSS